MEHPIPDPDPAAAGQTPATLLFVDDEPSILSALRRLFRPTGHRVLTAESGSAGLEILQREAVHLVISDMRMPQMDGSQFLERARALQPRATRILLTGYADVGSTIAAINRGEIFRYIAKPWDDNDILLVVRHALERRALELENARLLDLTRRQNADLQKLNASLEDQVAERTATLNDTLRELEQTHGTLKKTFLTTVRVLAGLGELRAASLAGHSRRVAEHARALAQRIGLDEAQQQEITLAALLHDIGKIGLSDEVLATPFSQLTGPQRGEAMQHPEKGQLALMELEQLAPAAGLVRHHHENYDGSGYPDRLEGTQIPLGARILAIANDYDALQTGTLHAVKLGAAEALAQIRRGRGRRYDPALVDAFEQLIGRPARPPAVECECRTGALRPGMTLARDLVHRDGYLLLARGFVLSAAVIEQLRRLERAEGRNLSVCVRKEATADASS